MDKDLAEVYVAISQEVFLLHSRWCEYLTLYGTSKDHIEVMNKIAPNFFSIIQNRIARKHNSSNCSPD